MREKKTGRRASPEERALAGKIVSLYRLAEESPNGKYCINPESSPEDHEFFWANAEELLALLEGFAEHGTFEFIDQIEFDILDIHHAVKDLRDKGLTRENAVAIVAEKHHKSCRQIERELARASKSWSEHFLNGQTQAEWEKSHPKPR
jgi:hypothetical protein